MTTLRLYIWEGGGVSCAYHDDGTVVVLASSPQEARETVWAAMDAHEAAVAEAERQRDAYMDELRQTGQIAGRWTQTDKGKAIWAMFGWDDLRPDGMRSAFERDPDRTVDIDGPCVVAFNGGGYD